MAFNQLFIVLGPPGSGRATQCSFLAKRLECPLILMGQLVEEYIKGDSEPAQKAKELFEAGQPQPDDLILSLLREKFLKIMNERAILGKFPLSLEQAQSLDEMIRVLGINDFRVVYLNITKEEAVKRMVERKRVDDTESIASKRFDEYDARYSIIKPYYRQKGVLVEINADQSKEGVQTDMLIQLGFQTYAAKL